MTEQQQENEITESRSELSGLVRLMTDEQAQFVVAMIKGHLDAGARISANEHGVPVLVAEDDKTIRCGLRFDYSKA